MALFADTFVQEVTATVYQQQQQLSHALGIPPSPAPPADEHGQSPLQQDLQLLVDVANGRYLRTQTNTATLQQVERAVTQLLDLLLGNALHTSRTMPEEFWQSEIGILVSRVRWWLSVDDLITISNAAALVFGENSQANRMRIARAIDKGALDWVPDPLTANPQHNKRVLRSQVEHLRALSRLPD